MEGGEGDVDGGEVGWAWSRCASDLHPVYVNPAGQYTWQRMIWIGALVSQWKK
jgi:hypothetical protein